MVGMEQDQINTMKLMAEDMALLLVIYARGRDCIGRCEDGNLEVIVHIKH